MEELEKALELKKELDSLRPIDPETEAIIMQKFRLDWNYHSNHLEGNALTYGETKALLLFNITAQGKPLKDHIEVTGHNEAINWVLDLVKGDRPLSESFIRQIHQLLLKEPYETYSETPDGKPTKKKVLVGEYKKTPNHVKTVTGEIFRFATPEETPAKMTDLLNWYRDKTNDKTVNPILVAAEFHYKFIRIHPFDDGNGRTARIIMNFILMKYGFPPTIIKTEDKENYFAALRLADAGNIEAFINYIAQNLVYSLELMISGAKGEPIEEEDDIMKELKILEKRLERIENIEYATKNVEETHNIVNLSALRVFARIKKRYSGLFDSFYEEQNFLISFTYDEGNNETFTSFDSFNAFPYDSMYDSFTIRIVFEKFKSKKLNLKHSESIVFEFKDYYYEVFIGDEWDEYRKKYLRKNYRNHLTDEEINDIISKVITKHKNSLELTIAKKEKEDSKKQLKK